MVRYCLRCGASFEVLRPSDPKKYCTKSCAAKVNNTTHPKRSPKVGSCRECGIPVKNRRRLCDKHWHERSTKSLTLEEVAERVSAKGKHPSWRWAFVRSANRQWNRKKAKGCVVCGYEKHIELAHIRAISSFPMTATLSEVNSPSNVTALCPNHHWEFDHGLLDGSMLAPLSRIELDQQS